MKFFTVLCLLFSTSITFGASTHQGFKLELSHLDGTDISNISSEIYTEFGNKFYLGHGDLKVELQAVETKNNYIDISAKIYKNDKLIGKPRVITEKGKKAIIKTESENGEILDLSVTPI